MLVKKKPVSTKTVVPFNPALNTAIAMLLEQVNANIKQLIEAEAVSLKLPQGWSADIGKREWQIP